MKRLIAVLLTLSATHASAGPLADIFTAPAMQQICAQVVQPAPDLGKGYWRLWRPHLKAAPQGLFATLRAPDDMNAYVVVSVDNADLAAPREVIRFKEPIRDLVVAPDHTLWVLLAQQLVNVDPSYGKILSEVPTSDQGQITDDNQTAQSMALVGQRLIIAHGTLGITAYDLAARTIVFGNGLGLTDAGGNISKATAILSDGDHAWLAAENLTVTDHPPYTFDGLIDLNFGGGDTFATRFEFDHAASGWLTHAYLALNGSDQIVINNWGVLQVASKVAMQSSNSVQVRAIPTTVTIDGVTVGAELMGDILTEENHVFGCAQAITRDQKSGIPNHLGTVIMQGL